MNRILTITAMVFCLALIPAVSPGGWWGGQRWESVTMEPVKVAKSGENISQHRASEIVRSGVQNHQREYLGVIRDLAIDPQNGGVVLAILSPGGVLGIPMKFVAVPFSALAFDRGREVYLLDATRETMASAPGFERGQRPRTADRTWEADVYRYYGQTPLWGEDHETMVKGQSPLYHFNEIRGASVRNLEGEKLGDIRDLVVDSQGHVSFALIAHGGFWGVGAKLAAVPFSALKTGEKRADLVLDSTKEKLDFAPGFEESRLTDWAWAAEVYRFFGQTPYWTE